MPRVRWTILLLAAGLAACQLPGWNRGPGAPTAENSATTAPVTQPVATRPVPQVSEAAILEPSQGRPIILRPNDRFYFLMALGGEFDGDVYVSLVHAMVGELYFPLTLADKPNVELGKHASMVLRVPNETPPGLYDLRVRSAGKTLTARHSVKVVKELKSRFRFVHLSDMNVGDPTAPDFDPYLPAEVNILAPEFIIATGNYLDAATAGGSKASWQRVLDYFARFNAPVYILCGRRDDADGFSPTVATSPVGSFNYGRYHGVLLLNQPDPLIDASQIDFVRRDLAENRDIAFTFIAMNDDDPRVIEQLAGDDPPARFLERNRIRMLICGGTGDWDGREYADTLAGLPGLHYIRTHPASTCRQGFATGTTHFRVIEVNDADISYIYPSGGPDRERQHSIPCGGLAAATLADASPPPTDSATVVRNSLNQPFADCRLWIPLRKNGDAAPKVAGGQLVQALDARSHWLCEVRVDLPDCGGLRIAASVDRDPPAPLPVAVEIIVPDELPFSPATTNTGLRYCVSGEKLVVRLRNVSTKALRLRPIVRLLGQVLAPVSAEKIPWPLDLPAGQAAEMQMQLLLPHVVEGTHYVQVCFLDDPLQRLYMQPVILRRASPTTKPTPSAPPPEP